MIIVVTEYETITFHISATLLPENPLDKPAVDLDLKSI